MSQNDNIRLTTADGKAPETVRPGPGEEPEREVLQDEAAPSGSRRVGRGGKF